MNFSETLKHLREDAGYTQEELAKTLSVSKTTISHYEIGLNMPNIVTLLQIADLFNVSLDYLMGRLSVRMPHDIMHKQFVKGTNNASLIERLNTLDTKHRQIIIDLLNCVEADNYLNNARSQIKR